MWVKDVIIAFTYVALLKHNFENINAYNLQTVIKDDDDDGASGGWRWWWSWWWWL